MSQGQSTTATNNAFIFVAILENEEKRQEDVWKIKVQEIAKASINKSNLIKNFDLLKSLSFSKFLSSRQQFRCKQLKYLKLAY